MQKNRVIDHIAILHNVEKITTLLSINFPYITIEVNNPNLTLLAQ